MLFSSQSAGAIPRPAASTPEGEPMALKEYDVEINGQRTTLQLSDEDAKLHGLTKADLSSTTAAKAAKAAEAAEAEEKERAELEAKQKAEADEAAKAAEAADKAREAPANKAGKAPSDKQAQAASEAFGKG